MQFVVYVAADCDGSKINVRFAFANSSPSLTQVLQRANEVFVTVFQQRSILRTFAISAPVIFNDVTCTWDRLERSVQMQHHSQIYLFQPDILDLPGEIPDPEDSSAIVGPRHYDSPLRGVTSASLSYSPRAEFPTENIPLQRAYSNFSTPQDRSLSFGQFTRPPAPVQDRIGPSNGGSIFREERSKMAVLEQLPIDELRSQLRREAREFSSSPSRPSR
jgi:hypothetical protein